MDKIIVTNGELRQMENQELKSIYTDEI